MGVESGLGLRSTHYPKSAGGHGQNFVPQGLPVLYEGTDSRLQDLDKWKNEPPFSEEASLLVHLRHIN